jgi:hypothetical protein
MTTDLVQPEMWMISSHLRPRLGWKSGGVMTPTTLDISTDEKIEESSESPSPRHPPDLEQSGDLFYGTDLTDAEEGDQGLAAAAAEMFVTEWRCAAAAKACSKASRPTCAAMCPCILYNYYIIYRAVAVWWWQGASGLDTARTGVANISCSSAVLGGRLRCQHSASEQVLRSGTAPNSIRILTCRAENLRTHI